MNLAARLRQMAQPVRPGRGSVIAVEGLYATVALPHGPLRARIAPHLAVTVGDTAEVTETVPGIWRVTAAHAPTPQP